MDILDRAALLDLLDADPKIAVSLFMPGHGNAGREARQDPIRFKNLLESAERQLRELDVPTRTIAELLAPGRERVDRREFWLEDGDDSLAMFMAPGLFRHYRVPVELAEQVSVDTRFKLKPLLPALDHAKLYYILALSENHNRLVLVNNGRAAAVELPGVPANLNESMKLEDREEQLQMHSSGSPQSGNAAGIFHGGGSWHDYEKAQLGHYLGQIDAAVVTMLSQARPPLLLAGVEALVAAYRNHSGYPVIIADEYLAGNHDHTPEQKLAEAAWPIIDAKLNRGGTKLARMRELAGTAQGSTDAADVVQACINGRVATLFLDPSAELRGSYDPQSGEVRLAALAAGAAAGGADGNSGAEAGSDGVDLLELASAHALRSADEIVTLPREQIPGDAGIAALLRW